MNKKCIFLHAHTHSHALVLIHERLFIRAGSFIFIFTQTLTNSFNVFLSLISSQHELKTNLSFLLFLLFISVWFASYLKRESLVLLVMFICSRTFIGNKITSIKYIFVIAIQTTVSACVSECICVIPFHFFVSWCTNK